MRPWHPWASAAPPRLVTGVLSLGGGQLLCAQSQGNGHQALHHKPGHLVTLGSSGSEAACWGASRTAWEGGVEGNPKCRARVYKFSELRGSGFPLASVFRSQPTGLGSPVVVSDGEKPRAEA